MRKRKGSREKANTKMGIVKRIGIILWIPRKINAVKNRINKQMENRYSARKIAGWMTGAMILLASVMLLIPNYLGVADDGTVTETMHAAGVYYAQDTVEDVYNNYFVRTYSRVAQDGRAGSAESSSQILLIKTAVYMDDLFTQDKFFDIRFLAILYLLLYIPAFYLFIRQACERGKKFSEGMTIGIIGLVIFADVGFVTYFNSFYPEAVWGISMMYITAAGLAFQKKQSWKWDLWYLGIFLLAGTVLVTSKWQCACIGIILAIFCIKLIYVNRHWLWGVVCVLSALYLTFVSILSMGNLQSDFNTTSKLHAMTRGVLFQADNPAETLQEFGISQSYELLADASAYDSIPIMRENDKVLQKEFLEKYSTYEIALYYLRHPGKMLSMVDVAIKSSHSIRRDYCGNYEQSVGMPPKAKSLFWSSWSILKQTSLPKTIGSLVILLIGIILLFGRGYSLRPVEERYHTIFMDMLICVVCILLSQAMLTVIFSGDAEMVRHCYLVSDGIDILTYYVLAEILHKLNIV